MNWVCYGCPVLTELNVIEPLLQLNLKYIINRMIPCKGIKFLPFEISQLSIISNYSPLFYLWRCVMGQFAFVHYYSLPLTLSYRKGVSGQNLY